MYVTHSESTAKPSVCFVAPTAFSILSGRRDIGKVGGAELQQVILARALAERGYTVSMICIDHGQDDAAVIDGVTTYKCFRSDTGLPGLRALTPRLTGLWSALRRADADVYFQRTATRFTGVTAAFSKVYRRKSIYSAANDPDFAPGLPKLRFRIDKAVFAYGVRNVDAILVQNRLQKELCQQQFSRESYILRNCLPRQISEAPGIRKYVLWVATLKPEKRPDLFLKLAQDLPDIRFVMVGGPSDQKEELFESIRHQASRIHNLEFVGFVPYVEVGEYFDNAALLVNTSDYEGFPNTFLQAWARQVPTISFINPVDSDDKDSAGLSVKSLAEMKALIAELMTNSSKRAKLGRLNLAHFERHHSVSAVVDQFEKFLVETVSK